MSGPTGEITPEHREELLKRNPSFCMAAWMHLHVPAEGQVTPCCQSREQLGNINRQSFKEIWHGAPMARMRAAMLRGEKLASCGLCYDKEAGGTESLRQEFNDRWGRRHFGTVAGTSPDGEAPNAAPLYWDIRFSNICNFRCRSCWHGSSSRWFADATALGTAAGDKAIIHGVEDADSLFDQLDDFLPAVEEIYFAGGEPLIMEEHYRLLDLLIARGRTDVSLNYNTNLSVTGYKGLDALERWNKFSKVRVAASIDATGARGELMRKEQSWPETVENARLVRSRCPHVKFCTDTTVSIFNILHLPALVRELADTGFVPVANMTMHVLQTPVSYNIRALPAEMKQKVRSQLAELQVWLEARLAAENSGGNALAHHRTQIAEILSYMDSEDWSHLLPLFRESTAQLDRLRSETTADIFPELAPLLVGNTGEKRLLKWLRQRTAGNPQP